MVSMTFEKLTADTGGDFGSMSPPAAAIAPLSPERLKELRPSERRRLLAELAEYQTLVATAIKRAADFDPIAVKVPIGGLFFEVAIPNETYDQPRMKQHAIAVEMGGLLASRDANQEVANYLLDREACYLLAQNESGRITEKEASLLTLHQEKWKKDTRGEHRAKMAGEINPKEAAILQVYREKIVQDTQVGIGVRGVTVYVSAFSGNYESRRMALVICQPYAEPK